MRATTVLAATLAAAAAFTLTACGGSGGSDAIDGGSSSAPSTSASQTATTAPPTAPPVTEDPHLALPKDLKLVFDWPVPSDHAQAAALGNAANFLRSIAHGIVHRNVNEPLVGQYSQVGSGAMKYAQQQIRQAVHGGWTLTGTDRYYHPTVRLGSAGNGATVGFCDFDGKEYGRDVKTHKLVGSTAVNDSSYVYFTIVMAKFPTGHDLWQAVSVDAKEKATQCKE